MNPRNRFSHITRRRSSLRCALLSLCVVAAGVWRAPAPASLPRAQAQSLSFDRERGRVMLGQIKSDLKKHYYDPTLHGLDVDARFRQAEEEIKRAATLGQITAAIAQALLDLNDSHTFFLPPTQSTHVDYGWEMQMIGDKCYVIAVRPGSDAAAKGLKAGDRVLSVNGFAPTRADLWKMKYYYQALSLQTGLAVVAQSPGAAERALALAARVRSGPVVYQSGTLEINLEDEKYRRQFKDAHRYYTVGEDLLIWRMSRFNLTKDGVDDMMNKARRKRALILDLRGNGGGAEETLLRLIGNFFDRDIKVGDIKRRTETKPLVAKTRGGDIFKGTLVVLLDSASGSAAEVFARVVQLEKRGTVIGDRSAGAVMRSRTYFHSVGPDSAIFYGASITDADLIMTDGKSLEHTGVVPDKLLIPGGIHLATGRDPALAYAAGILDAPLDAAKAGALFPFVWYDDIP
jgi:C-terminal processing protease CtpA/Prc